MDRALQIHGGTAVIRLEGDVVVDTTPRLEVLKVTEPAKRQAGDKVGSVDELIAKLKTLGVVA